MRQEKSQRHGGDGGDDDATAPEASGQERREKLDADATFDEIDDVLEENAEEFVRSYVQEGGE